MNKLALKQANKFKKKASLNTHNIHNEDFHGMRNKFPFFGFVEIHTNECEPFLMYSNHDDLVAQTYFWYGNNSYERQSLVEWVKRVKTSSVIFDIGAYTGIYALTAHFANINSNIHAFEPTRRVYSRLLSNIQLNQVSNRITIINNAVSNKQESVNFHQYRDEHILGAGASFIDKKIKIVDSSELVQTITIDDYIAKNMLALDLVKIDVEEAELMVLEGMNGVLDRDGPDVLIEVTPHTVHSVVEKLKKHSYRFYTIDDDSTAVSQSLDPKSHVLKKLKESGKNRIAVNILAERN